MIEIRELIIRATVEDTPVNDGRRIRRRENTGDKNGCCEENLDLILKIIKDKKER